MVNARTGCFASLAAAHVHRAQALEHICETVARQIETAPCIVLFCDRGATSGTGHQLCRKIFMGMMRSEHHPLIYSAPECADFTAIRLTRQRHISADETGKISFCGVFLTKPGRI